MKQTGSSSLMRRALYAMPLPALLLAAPVATRAQAAQSASAPATTMPAQVRDGTAPNVIVIVTDDQGYHDVGFNGSTEIPTPNIDRITEGGARFTRGYVTFPVCGPSRAGLLSGRYQERFGFDRNPNNNPADVHGGMPLNQKIMPEIMKEDGYNTMCIGKWHMGTNVKLRPRRRGCDEFYGFLAGGHRYFPREAVLDSYKQIKKPYDWYRLKLLDNGKRVVPKHYLTTEFADQAVNFIERKAHDKKPFFIYLAFNAPHTPLEAPQKYLDRFKTIKNKTRRTYDAMISALDDGVGQVLDTLDKEHIAKNTVIFYLSDNGGVVSWHNGEPPVADNAPLRGGKTMLYEGGIRVPFAMRWPGKVKAGTVYKRPVSSLDILATLTDEIGLTRYPSKPLDGVDLIPYLDGQKKGDPHNILFWSKWDQHRAAVLVNNVKLVMNNNGTQLYNLAHDEGERHNLAKKNHKVVHLLQEKWDYWNAEMARVPSFKPLGTWPPYHWPRKTKQTHAEKTQ